MTLRAEEPFTLAVPDADLELLRTKLSQTRFPDELDDAGWAYGVPLADLRRLVARWQDGFDWRAAETAINAFPQFTRDIEVDGFGALNIHYVHQKSEVTNAVPLLFLHGWPGNFLEVRKILPLLTAGGADWPSFHVVAPSLPGFGFSENPKKKGFKVAQYAETAHKLMLALGYHEYVIQGGDWGFAITRHIAFKYGLKHVKAWHTNSPVASPPRLTSNPVQYFRHLLTPYTSAERAGIKRTEWFRDKGQGYSAEQSTQPQTLGYGLTDSPAGLLAWIYEKLVNWTDGYEWEDDEVLTWISIYWFSRAGPAATLRIYYETMDEFRASRWSSVPVGLSFFPKELMIFPRAWARTIGKVVFESEHERGGHFAAYERPEDLVGDVRKMFGRRGPAFGVVKGKSGYGSSDN